jgi:acetyltransferase-like isoleucine patch superfamily enzyme
MESISFYIAKFIRRLHRPAIRSSHIDKTARVCSNSHVNSTELGKYSYIGNNCFTNHVKIGAFCSIADNCFIGGAAHPIDFVSTSPVFCEGANIMGKNFSEKEFNVIEETEIGNEAESCEETTDSGNESDI